MNTAQKKVLESEVTAIWAALISDEDLEASHCACCEEKRVVVKRVKAKLAEAKS